MKKDIEALLSLIRCALFGTEPCEEIKSVAKEHAESICKMAMYHDAAHLLAYAYKKSGIKLEDADVVYKLKWHQAMAIMRYENLRNEYDAVSALLEKDGIDFIPLKGIKIRELYPEAWMRTSCDMDILVREEDVERAVDAIVEKLGYKQGERDYHDISLFSPTGEHLELHFSIKENRPGIDFLLEKIWEYAFPVAENKHEYTLENEFLVFHGVSHMSYHFTEGGCGIKSFADLLFITQNVDYDREKLASMLYDCKIHTFYNAALKLAGVWFGNDKHDDVTLSMQRYLLRGGVYGSKENLVKVNSANKGKLSYVISRIFMPYEQLIIRYPEIEGKKYLVPFYQAKRWFESLVSGRMKESSRELSISKNITESELEKVSELLKKLELVI